MMECKKCHREITRGRLCERCKNERIEKFQRAGKVILYTAGSITLLVITKGKIRK